MSGAPMHKKNDDQPPVRRAGSLWHTVKAVAWGFFGVRKNSEYQKDIARLSPLHIIAVGFVAVLVFIGVLLVLVKLAVAG
ncbi:DUF2970 domain-containing protein [Xenophilus arseniciresistens]|uniref:DUF2970 domain-containing protein n=1 Tax=Xenophilus arseniciresistens TaxID=1283306 RepID=A0AAE3N8M8_9BURK|nr:DUF2970 domain-containing protein [Xenophilus arseniciresistens]MDA7416828.1 DUF2970 domain-containing protein [Xenophilus arseniciresistens]